MAQLTQADPMRDNVFNSMYGGFGGGSVLPPPTVMTVTYWDEQKIETTVTERWIQQQLPESLREKLNEPMDSGDSLTDSTYADWILERAKKLFLILLDLGCQEKIFDLIDGSSGAWDDYDLPLPLESLEGMKLGENLEKRFFKKQYQYLLRDLEAGQHIEYASEEFIPIETVYRPELRGVSSIDKVYYPRNREVFYSRRRIPLESDEKPENMTKGQFLEELESMKRLSHAHIVSVHASYTKDNVGYILLYPTLELSLRDFLHYPAYAFRSLTKEKRKLTIIDWMHCISDAVAYLNETGIEHNSIKPSAIIVDTKTFHIYLSDIGFTSHATASASSSMTSQISAPTDIEAYDYGAPEHWVRHMTIHSASPNASGSSIFVSGRLRRKQSLQATNISTTIPETPISPSDSSPPSSPNMDRHVQLSAWRKSANISREKAQVFSLGCVFLDILTFYCKKRTSSFVSHRTSKSRRSREGAPPDASFHANMPQVETWIEQLEKYAGKKGDIPLGEALGAIHEMLERNPLLRPGIRRVEETVYRVAMGISENEMPHCGQHTVVGVDPNLALLGGWSTCGGTTRTSGTSTESTDEVLALKMGLDKMVLEDGKWDRRRESTATTSTGYTHGSKSSGGKSKRSTGSTFGSFFGRKRSQVDEVNTE